MQHSRPPDSKALPLQSPAPRLDSKHRVEAPTSRYWPACPTQAGFFVSVTREARRVIAQKDDVAFHCVFDAVLVFIAHKAPNRTPLPTKPSIH